VIFSVVSGSANFISETFPENVRKHLILFVGGLSIFTSIVSSIGAYLKLAELSEGNRMASLHWGKLYSRIKCSLYLQRENREDCRDFLMSVITEHERLNDISPSLLKKHVSALKKKINKNALDHGFVLPFSFNGFQHMRVYDETFEDNSV
jgi:hypothetical protein